MRTDQDQDVAGIVAAWKAGTIHVWRMRYERASRREPLRSLLGVYLGLPSRDVHLVEGAHGRPELAEPWRHSLRFNWSHSGNVALVAVARDVAPGIDVEHVRARPRAMALAERFFHPEESAALAQLDPRQREVAFLRLWTGKEAVLKALGRGIAFGLDRLRLSVEPACARLLWLDGDDAGSWQLHTIGLGSDYIASVAWRGAAHSVLIQTLADAA